MYKRQVKTRIGIERPEEGYTLMKIYNQYPVSEVIIHPRTRKEYYKGEPHLDVFSELLAMSKHPVCYNGNLFTVRDYEQFRARFPQVERVMIGRGVLADPGLMQRLKSLEHAQKTGEDSDRKGNGMEQSGSEIYRTGKQELRAFHDTIFRQYREIFDEDKNAIFHMKELWSYLVHSFEGSEPYAKKLRKTSSLNEYRCEVGNLFRACDLYPDGPVQWRP